MLKKTICIVLAVLTVTVIMPFSASAKDAVYEDTEYTATGFDSVDSLFDAKRESFASAGADSSVTVTREDGISHLYIEFDRIPSVWTIEDASNGQSVQCGKNSFLHEYVDVYSLFGTAPKSITLCFDEGTAIADIYAFSSGTLPEFVQIWQPPLNEADLMLVVAHSDDDQLFFAGTLPYYAIERDVDVQVVYSVQHFQRGDTLVHDRPHEQLDGLWTVGITSYPLISDIPDIYAESKDRDTAYAQMETNFAKYGVTISDFEEYFVECIRRCKPLVVVTHDLNGEYGHGAHIFVAESITKAIDLSDDADAYSDSASKYGLWSPEKTYLHLYEQNPVLLDWDTSYESMGGKTPFQMSQDGFRCHVSQRKSRFFKWIYGDETSGEVTKASQIELYSPCQFGLYDTKVGADVKRDDFLENVTTYAQRNAEQESSDLPESEDAAHSDAVASDVESEAADSIDAPVDAMDDSDGGSFAFLIWIPVAVIASLAVVFFKNRKSK